MKTILSSLLVALVISLPAAKASAQQLSKDGAATLHDGKSTAFGEPAAQNYGEAVAISGDFAFVAEPQGALVSGNVTVLGRSEDGIWSKVGELRAEPDELGNRFGSSIDARGDRVIVGAPGALGGVGAAYVFQLKDGAWQLETVFSEPDLGRTGEFGLWSVAIHGSLAAVGSGRLSIGFVYGLNADTGEWEGIGTIDSDDADLTAFKVALTDERLAASALFANAQSGRIVVAERDSTGEGVIIGDISAEGAFRLGRDLAIDGDVLVAGQQADGGSTLVFEYDGAVWKQTHTVEFFSGGIDASDGSIIVANVGSAEVTVFRKDGSGAWVVDGVLQGSGTSRDFGFDVDISGDYAVVGEPRRTSQSPGHAIIFERNADGEWEYANETAGAGETFPSISGGTVACDGGSASLFACSEIDLVSFVNRQDLLAWGSRMSDIWGWTDPDSGREYAIATHTDGTTFVDVTDAENPLVLGVLPIHPGSVPNTWHDVKVYQNHAFIVADGAGPAGMQVFDLTQLRSIAQPPMIFDETAHYDRVGSTHNIAINEETGIAYLVGASGTSFTCGGGLHMVDISNPIEPTFAGCYADPSTGRDNDGYTHDVECIVYDGPDADYQGREICFGSNETAIQITDVTDKVNSVTISTATYPQAAYVHQGTLSDDRRYFYQNDELDESAEKPLPTTLIWDIEDLDDPILVSTYEGVEEATDHNHWFVDGLLYQTNYVSGLRILDLGSPTEPVEIAYFDTAPAESATRFDGAWSSYPYFASGNVVVTSADEGLFVLRPGVSTNTSEETPDAPLGYALEQNYPNPFNPSVEPTQIRYTVPEATQVRVQVVDALGRVVDEVHAGEVSAGTHTVTWGGAGVASGAYHYRVEAGEVVLTGSMFVVR